MSIPGIFPIVTYKNHILMDGGATNNFPVNIAKRKYPNNDIIGIALNKFQENQKIKTIFDSLSVSIEILLRHHTVENMSVVTHLFYKKLNLKVLDINKKNMQKAYLDPRYKEGDFPATEMLCKSVISLPMHTHLDEEQLAYIASSVLEYFK